MDDLETNLAAQLNMKIYFILDNTLTVHVIRDKVMYMTNCYKWLTSICVAILLYVQPA